MKKRLFLFLLAIGVLAVCAIGISAGATSRPEPTASPAAVCGTRAQVCVGASNEGKVVLMYKGSMLRLSLHQQGVVFSSPVEQSPMLLRQIGPVSTAHGSVVASYKAVRIGITEITAYARPECRAGQVCPQYIRLWRQLVHVRP